MPKETTSSPSTPTLDLLPNGTNGHANGAATEAPPADTNASIEGKAESTGHTGWTPGFRSKTNPERALKFPRRFTTSGHDVFDTAEWEMRTASITGETGKSVFEQKNCEVPAHWSQLATNVVVSKYFRGPLGTPQRETSVKQVIGRVVDTIHKWSRQGNYFQTDEDAQAFRDELAYLLLHQYGSFNSPVWFNLGVRGARQQASACFINSVHDDMESIMELAATEARLFKGGSGAGTNLFRIRSSREQLSGGGIASGPVSFMRGWDAFAGAIKSGGTTRRAAKMVILNADHPDIEEFITAKSTEEKKAWALIEAGYNGGFNVPGGAYDSVAFQNANHSVRVTDEFMRAAENDAPWQTRAVTSGKVVEEKNARQLLHKIAESTHICGDPGLQYDTTLNDWHTCSHTDRIYASNPCCVTGDTLVAVADGRNAVAIRDLVGTTVPVYAHDHATGKTTVSRMWNISAKRQNAAIYRVTLDDGSSFRATDDHLIMLRDGSYRMVRDLATSDSLMPFHSKVIAPGQSRTRRRHIWTGTTWMPQYRAVWSYLHGEQPAGHHIHHADFDALNDALENLVLLEEAKHNALHTDQTLGDHNPARRLMNDEWRANIAKAMVGENNPHFGHKHSESVKAQMSAKAKARTQSAQARAEMSSRAKTWMAEAKAEGHVIGRPARKEKAERCCPVCRANFETVRIEQVFCSADCRYSPMGYAMSGGKGGRTRVGQEQTAEITRRAALTSHNYGILRAARLLMDNGVAPSVENWDDLRPQLRDLGVARVPAAATVARYFQDSEQLQEAATHFNHKVVSVEFCGHEDVFDGTVDAHHNFAIFTSSEAACVTGQQNFSGIFIHNSEFVFLDDTACITGETRVSSPEGLRTVAELFAAQQSGEKVFVTTDIVSENDHRRQGAHRRAWVTQTGEKQVFKIQLADGRRIRATGDHRFLTDGGWKRVDTLVVGQDRIQLRKTGNTVAFTSDKSDVTRWQMLGWLTGDGVFSKGNVALVFGPDEKLTAQAMEGEFNRLHVDARAYAGMQMTSLVTAGSVTSGNIELPRGGCHISAQANGVLQITSKSRALVSYLEEWYGYKSALATEKDVPAALHRVADDLKVAYLQGLFSADGCIRRDARGQNEEVMLASSSVELLRSVQLMLSDLGITSRIGWTHPAGRKNPQGQLHIYNQQARSFMSLIGFACSGRKQAQIEDILSRPFQGQLKQPRSAKVIAVVPDGVELVYDITEPVTHSFIAEGMVTHNCNLASMNLLKFYDQETGIFDVEAYIHASETFITAQEIIVSFASYPTEKIAENSEKYRPLGLGYCNLGALLMASGLAYDSDEGRAMAGALTAIMTGAAYRQSAKIAANTGPFEGYAHNRDSMLRVIGKHRDAVARIDNSLVAPQIMEAAQKMWDGALDKGRKNGFRNAQSTVLAPTGTIAFMMDADTTGVEPDIALVKYKKLVGGGLLKIVNQTVPNALRKLGYDEAEIKAIIEYIDKNDTIEGAPGLEDKHLSVFDCAFKAMNGTRSIHHMGHIKMMAAAQPFLSGAISKTVNMPQECTVDEIMDAYIQSWKLGVKAVAIYRDNSKRTQPLSTSSDAMKAEKKEAEVKRAMRRKLPDERQSITHKFSIAGQEGYFMVGLYDDGSPGEIFIKMSKEGSTISGLMDSFAVAVSLCLQYGVPLRVLVNKFSHSRFEPSGYTQNRDIPIAKSLMDYIFRWFDLKFHPNGDNGHWGKQPETEAGDAKKASEPELALGASASKPASRSVQATATPSMSLFSSEVPHAAPEHANGNLAHAQRELAQMQADAPPCPDCGAITVRSGACYKCNECGATTGCG